MRVVTLLPSATEMVFALGVEPVATSHECDHPPRATALPSANRSRVDPDASSADINEQVAKAEAGDGVYAVDRDALREADPDLVVTQGVCDVCAVDEVRVRTAVAECGLDADVLTMDVHGLADLYETIERLGAAMDRERAATALVRSLRARAEAVTAATPSTERGPRVAVLDWLDPVMVAGHWVPEMVQRAGGRYGLEAAGAHSRPREWATVREYDPEVLVLAPCGFDVAQTREHVADVTDRPGWDDLVAVRANRVYVLDGHHYVNRSGPRLVDTMELIGSLVHPPGEWRTAGPVERLD